MFRAFITRVLTTSQSNRRKKNFNGFLEDILSGSGDSSALKRPILWQERSFTSTSKNIPIKEIERFQAKNFLRRGFSTENTGSSHSKVKITENLLDNGTPRPSGGLRKGPVTWTSLALFLTTGVGLLYYYDSEKRKRVEGIKQTKSVGKAAIGGPFSLVDHFGKPVTEQNLKGSWNLLYFGFTYCPDICPDELLKMAEAVNLLEKNHGIKIRPVFISIDPERDSVEQVREYVKEFHPRLLGLTGPTEAVKAAARAYRVYYMKTEEEGDDYLVDHSIIMYLMDPNMEFVKFFGKNYNPESLAAGIVEEVNNWKLSN